jgi:hypothetical protein
MVILSGCAVIQDPGLSRQKMAAKLNRHTCFNLFAYPAFRHIASMYNGGDQPREKSQFARPAMRIQRVVLG